MESFVELPVALPGLRVVAVTTCSLGVGVKEHFGFGRIERGETEWWGGGAVRRSRPGHVLVKQPGDVVRHLAHRGPTTFTAVFLPTAEVTQALNGARPQVVPQLEAEDPRALPFHRLLDGVRAGDERLALEVALAEAVLALAGLDGHRGAPSRPVRRSLDYLRDRLHEPILLDELARHVGFDKFHLCRAFRAQVGMPPHAYLTHLRITRAKELLRRGVRPAQVAALVGLCDQARLTRHFRRLVGTTPARYARASAPVVFGPKVFQPSSIS